VTDPRDRPLDERDLDPDPLAVYRRWFREATEAGAFEPEAAALATATPEGRPSVRMVLVKGADERGLAFYTNYASRKGGELAANPRAAIVFHWPALGRQVRVEGAVERLPRDESEAYARSRSRASRLSALASPQSRPVESREWLERRVAEVAGRHEGSEIPVQEDWGGYRLVPDAWEFWQHRPNRLHDRFRYLPDGERWRVERLGP
jgi:pyridoxamine 5'-phosphate oxidase